MKNTPGIFTLAALASSLLLGGSSAFAHCEVPCGIYGDQLRFEAMLEDQSTVAKANGEIAKYAAEASKEVTPLLINQSARWVTTKEDHCTKIQQTIAQYFMTQRIKPGDDNDAYVKKLTAAHAVMQAAMKSKQDPSEATAAALKKSILDFYRAYEGKEPDFEAHSH